MLNYPSFTIWISLDHGLNILIFYWNSVHVEFLKDLLIIVHHECWLVINALAISLYILGIGLVDLSILFKISISLIYRKSLRSIGKMSLSENLIEQICEPMKRFIYLFFGLGDIFLFSVYIFFLITSAYMLYTILSLNWKRFYDYKH